jgi:SNF2 family DNA or RNA helicase
LTNKIITRGFYIEYRLSLIFARSDSKAPLPRITSLEQWAEIKSTKLDMAARLCQYFLTRDDLPLPTFANGSIDFPAIPPAKNGFKTTKDSKIVVFTEFPSMLSLFIDVSAILVCQIRDYTHGSQVFGLYGVEVLAVNGSMSFDKRAATIKKFRESPIHRVLALSSVGTVGINLSFCRFVIFLVCVLLSSSSTC